MTPVAPPITEREFMAQVTQLAEIRGWSWAHFRPAMTAKGWRTPVSGPLGKGWPDLVLVRGKQILFAELKRDGAKETPEQRHVLNLLAEAHPEAGNGIVVWRPRDWDRIEYTLR